MRSIIRSWFSVLVAFLLTPVTLAHAALWTITLSGTARTPPGVISGFTVGQQRADYTWDPAQVSFVSADRVEGRATATYSGLFNGAESGLLAATTNAGIPGAFPIIQLVTEAVNISGTPLTPSFFTDPQPLSVERSSAQVFHNDRQYAWGAGPDLLTSVFITVGQPPFFPVITEPGTAVLFASSVLSVLLLGLRRRN